MAESRPRLGFRKVRPVSRETRFARLKSLKCFKEVHDRVLAGWPVSAVASFIQKDRREYLDVSIEYLKDIVHSYRDSLPPGEVVSRRIPQFFMKAMDKVEEGLDELKELENLYRLQLGRIEIDLAIEKKIRKLVPTMTQEIREARNILESIAQLKMDLGLKDRHLGSVDVDAALVTDLKGKYGSESVSRVLGNPESVRKVLGLAEQFMRRSDEGYELLLTRKEPEPELESGNKEEDV